MDNSINVDIKNTEAAIEAILFAAGHPVTYEKLAEVLDLFESQVREKVFAFADEYNKDPKKGIMLLTFDDMCQLCTKEIRRVKKGVFGADMSIDLCCDGPVTIVMDSNVLFKNNGQ